ncbi:MAG: hypothetical protein LH647_05905 [Leptolyngbyaceae cyanobacterium CAN_BIN12]|nr:hypothetical protein [Leptolyngbyaceae cyanobacterium CAN_BIN12]
MNRDNSLKTGFLNGLVGLYVEKSWASGEIARFYNGMSFRAYSGSG